MGKIVWLASYPKSGNTWLRIFLHNYIRQRETPQDINILSEYSASECAAAFFRPYDARPATDYTTAQIQAMRPNVHRDLTRLHQDLVFIKTHNANLALHGVPFCTPAVTAGAVYLVRDPRDVAVSYALYTGRPVDEIIGFMAKTGAANRSTGEQVFELLSSWSGHVDSWTGETKNCIIRYEDLQTAPAEHFGRIIHYLGGDAQPGRLRRAIAFSSFDRVAAQERETGYTENAPTAATNFFRAGTSGQWRTALTATQAARIAADHGATMKRFGYVV